MTSWKLKQTAQCAKCPWRVDVDPHELPNGYSVDKHAALASTIAAPGALPDPGAPLRVMACHEPEDAHCVGWLLHQLGQGNNLALRLRMLSCANAGELRLRGAQHQTFEATLPREAAHATTTPSGNGYTEMPPWQPRRRNEETALDQ